NEPRRYVGTLPAPYLPIEREDESFDPSDIRAFYPDGESIPDEFCKHHNSWQRFIATWFYSGLPEGVEFIPKRCSGKDTAIRHLATVLHTFDTPHEFKMATAAFLASTWFDDIHISGKSIEKKDLAR